MAKETTEKETGEYVPYHQRLNEATAEAQKELFKKREAKRIVNLNENEVRFAKAFINLYSNPDFKTFMEFENHEASERIVRALDAPAATEFNVTDYGLQMAFNKGRQFQMTHLRLARESIMKQYLANLQRDKKEESDG